MAQTIKLKRSGTQGAAPSTSNLELGEVAINTYDGKMYIKKSVNGTESIVEVGGSGTVSYLEAGMIEYEYTATSNQTTFSGSDSNSATLSYTANSIMVFLNGVLQDDGVDYTATNGTSVVFTSALTANDEVRIVAFTNVTTAGTLQNPTKLDAITTVNNQAAYSLTVNSSAYTPSSQNALIVSLNGITQEPGDSFTISGSTITFSPALVTGDVVDYIVDMGRAVTIGQYDSDLVVTNGNVEVPDGEFVGDLRGATLFKGQAGEALSKGDVVYISGISGNTTVVSKADADDAAKMPAFGIVAAAANINTSVSIYTFGELSGLNTSSYSEGDELYVSTTAGALTNSAPTGESSKLQKIAKVTRSDNSAGSIFIMGAGRSNAVPNLDDGDIFIGNASNQAVTAALDTSIVPENGNLYFTTARVDSHLSGGTGVTYNAGEISIGQDVSTTATPTFGNITTTGYIAGPSTFTIDPAAVGDNTGTLVVAGNLQVDGTTTTINSTTMTVDDLNITLASGAANAAAANGAGITVDGASATLTYNSTPDAWSFNKNLGIGTDTPAQLLDVGDHDVAGNRSIRISQRTGTNTTTYGGLEFFYNNTAGTTAVNAAIYYAAGSQRNYGELAFHTGNAGTNVERVRIDRSGNVGIGTSTPESLLHLVGGSGTKILIEDSANLRGNYIGLELSDNIIIAADEDNLGTDSSIRFRIDADEKMRITSNGDVGIGITPNHNLHLHQVDSGGTWIQFTNSTTGTTTADGAIVGLDSAEEFNIRVYENKPIDFWTNNTERMRIDSDGNVGIGTNDPQALLDVRANTNATVRIANDSDGIATLYLRNTGTNDGSITQEGGDMFFQIAGDKKVELRNDGNFGIGQLNPDARLGVETDQQLIARLASSNTSITGVRLQGYDASAADTVYVDWFYDAENRQYGFGEGTASGSLPINSGVSHADIIFNNGNVRIPSEIGLSNLAITTNPLTLGNLTAFNLAFDSNEIQARNNGASNNLILNKNGGTVGIGTTSTTYKLEVESTGDSGIRYTGTDNHASLFLDSASGYGQYLRFSEAGTHNWWIVADTLGDLNFRPNASSQYSMRLRENYKIETVGSDTVGNSNYYHVTINNEQTGSDTLTADRTHVSLFVNTDNSQSGGDIADEIRSYGVYADTRITSDADLCVGVMGYARTDKSSGTTTNVRGGQFQALGHDSAGGVVSNIQGVYASAGHYQVETTSVMTAGSFLSQATTTGNGDITNFEGVRGETQVDSGYTGTIATGFTFRAMHDNNNGSTHTHNTHYLYYGDYTGTLPTTARGLWINDNVPSRFSGDLHVNGTLTKTSGSFLISHPLPSMATTHDLVHAFVESPQPDNIYSGMVALVDGSATINIDTAAGMTEGTFVLLNKNIRRTVTNEEGFTAVKSNLSGNILTITAQDNTCTDEVFWMVIGQRNDAEIRALHTTDSEGNLIVEPEKGPEWERPDRSGETTTTYDPENPFPDQE